MKKGELFFIEEFEKFYLKGVYWLARLIVPILVFFKITPNQVTFWGSVIPFSLATYCFVRGTYFWNLAGLFFLLMHYYFDCVDGALARATGQTSRVGRWMDLVFDYLGPAVFLTGIGYGIYLQTNDTLWLLLIIVIMFAKFALSVAHVYYGNYIYRSRKFLNAFQKDRKMTFWDKVIKGFVVPDADMPIFFFFYNIKYFLFIMIVLGSLKTFLIVTTVLFNLRWIILLWIYSKILAHKKTKLGIIKLLGNYIDGINFDLG